MSCVSRWPTDNCTCTIEYKVNVVWMAEQHRFLHKSTSNHWHSHSLIINCILKNVFVDTDN